MKTCLSNTTKRKYDRIDFLESDGTGIIKRNCHAKSERETEKRCLVEDPCNYTKHKIIPYRIQITNKKCCKFISIRCHVYVECISIHAYPYGMHFHTQSASIPKYASVWKQIPYENAHLYGNKFPYDYTLPYGNKFHIE